MNEYEIKKIIEDCARFMHFEMRINEDSIDFSESIGEIMIFLSKIMRFNLLDQTFEYGRESIEESIDCMRPYIDMTKIQEFIDNLEN